MIKSRRLTWVGHIARMEEGRSAVGKPTGKRPLGRPRHIWEDNNRMDLKEIGINTRNRVDSTWGLLENPLNAELNLRVP